MNFNNINMNFSKLRGIFTRSQKEIINTGDGKRNLYFDYNRKNYIKFSLDIDTTCDSIFRNHKDEIKNKIQQLYGNNVDLNNFGFLIVELNSNQYDGTPNLINVKLRKDDKIIFQVLLNSQLMLGFLSIIRQNIILKKKARNLGLLNPINLINFDTEEKPEEKKKDDNVHIYYSKNIIYYYHALAFSKEKMKITSEELYIYLNPCYRLLIKDIRSISTFLGKNEDDIKTYLKDYKIYGETPKFCIEIISKDDKKLLIGRNTYDAFMTLYRALDAAVYNYQNQYSHINIKKKIIFQNINIFSISNNFLKKTTNLDDWITHKDKRKIFFEDFEDMDLANIINNILEFKKNMKKGKYLNAISNIKNLYNIIDKIEKENKYSNIINEENMRNINNIWNKIKHLCNSNNENKENLENNKTENNLNEVVLNDQKKEEEPPKENNIENRIVNSSNDEINFEKNNINTKMELKDEQINELNQIINMNIFDNLYLETKEKYISRYYKENKNVNLIENSNMKLILGNYFSNNFQMGKEQDFLKIGGEELEKTIDDFNYELILEKKEKSEI